jgi:hypothetical protein
MTDDLRKQRSESPEGKGIARRAWEAYADAVNRTAQPLVEPLIRSVSYRWTEQMLGFWVAWHLYGGFEGLKRAGWSERTIYRRLKEFRLVFKTHPDSFSHPGVKLDPEAFWEWSRKRAEEEE